MHQDDWREFGSGKWELVESDGRGKAHVVTMNTCVRLPALLMMDFDDMTHMQSKDLFSAKLVTHPPVSYLRLFSFITLVSALSGRL